MMRILQAPWFAAVLGSVAYLATMAALIKLPAVDLQNRPGTHAVPSAGNDPSWKFRNPEFDQWVGELKAERENLAAREQQLKELQTRLESQRAELNTATQTIAQLQADFDRNVVRFNNQEDENLRREIKLLSAMPLETAVKMMGSMTDDEAIRLLVKMKSELASQMLDTLSKSGKEESKRASTLMDMMRRSVPDQTAKTAKPTG